jgi:hypothetical protein
MGREMTKRDQIIKLLIAGENIAKVAYATGVSRGHIVKVNKKIGLPPPRRGSRKPRFALWEDDCLDEINGA